MSLVATREVLAAGAAVELEVLVDLRLLLRDRRLVERELHPVVAVRDDLAHQRGVVGGDVVADELRHVREAHDPVVELDPLVHLAELDVADDVVERPGRAASAAPRGLTRWSAWRRSRAGRGRRTATRSTSVCRVSPYVAMAAIRTVPCSSVTRRAARATTVAPAERAWAMHWSTSGTSRAMSTTPSPCRRWWSSERAVGVDRAVDDEPDRAGAQHEGLVVAVAVLRAGVGLELHAPAPTGSSARSGSRCRPRSTIASHRGHREHVAAPRRTPRGRPAA